MVIALCSRQDLSDLEFFTSFVKGYMITLLLSAEEPIPKSAELIMYELT